ncbi:MAG: lasso peptide biosynthesis B2 protein [Candidatus Contendobacter sp.]|nr:lasso peptide biosynthesis B2 protein [Candidatus Contendobacter sp.]MDG4558385.1 lasso peptide biosynthesis B2 protein [Candidatus Contendobacter sp.]
MRDRWLRLRRQGSILWRLSWAERGWLLQAWLMLHGVALALRWAGFQRVCGWLEHGASGGGETLEDEDQVLIKAQALVRLVGGAAAWSLCRPTCLHRSLTLWWLLRRRGIACELRIGVRKEEGRFEAHAWVERQGMALNDQANVGQDFAPFDTARWSLP